MMCVYPFGETAGQETETNKQKEERKEKTDIDAGVSGLDVQVAITSILISSLQNRKD